MHSIRIPAGWWIAPSLCIAASVTAFAEDEIDFNRDVRPILSENCFTCHGPDEKKREADLRLDAREGLFGDRDGTHAVVAGKPEMSAIIERLTTDDEDLRMPPADFGKELTPEQVDVIQRWIEQGAEWQGHWAYIPPAKPNVPDVERPGFARNAIDHFVARMLERKGLAPAKEADRVTLIRRLSFDLRGLPPTVEEVREFVNDDSPDAYEKLVDRFLDSEHYGERMAAYWLDLVRYADTGGYHSDNHRDIWLYRDYVIRAFNENTSFDQFTIEQLAGDLVEKPTRWQRIASGYNRLLMTTEEGGAQAKEYTAKYAADRVRNVSTVWLGSTMGCSECHDHKYDPLTMRDFYSLAAFFADVGERAVGRQQQTPLPTPDQQAELDRIAAARAEQQKIVDTQTPALDAELAEWVTEVRRAADAWTVLEPSALQSAGGATLTLQEDGSVLATGTNSEKDVYTFTITSPLENATALRLETLPHNSLKSKGPGRADNGNFVLNEVTAGVGGQPVKWSHASATHSQKGFEVARLIDGNAGTGWAMLPETGKPHEAVLEFAETVTASEEKPLVVTLRFDYGSRHTIGHLRLSVTSTAKPVRAKGQEAIPDAVRATIALEPAERTAAQKAELAKFFRTIAPSLDPARKTIAKLDAERNAFQKTIPTTLVSMKGTPRTIRILPRGNWLDDSGEIVLPAVPAKLDKWELERRANRLDLAKWFVGGENPLTSRVMVNRLWGILFGRGIVATMDDFGSQGAWPTHPELLDWLAIEFVENGWDVKALVKTIVMSGTYRQSSVSTAELRRIDPYNKWLARQGRFRLDAEMVRDNALAVSGLLVRRIGGPSVKPYQPAGYWKHLNFPKRKWSHDANENQYRRGLYTYWQRSFLHPSLLAFDAPSREECTVERPRSNNPLQSLVLLNDPSYVEAARAFAESIVAKGGTSTEDRLRFAFRRALARDPMPQELSVLQALVEKHRAEYKTDPEAAQQLLSVGMRPIPAETDRAELAAWTSVARVLLNLHETITRS